MSANVSSVAQRKKQEEKNANAVRALLALPANKYCFECGLRGPTYANVTEGSFCCMHCSGLLRGLNPPHRVKSMSMSTFTDEEVVKLRQLGNEENAKIWLGLHDGKVKLPEPRVDDAVKQHMIQKYENKRWHVSPAELEEQKRLLAQHSRQSPSAVSTQSHQSNQSAPPNLHPTPAKNVDLLLEDLFSSSPSPRVGGAVSGSASTTSIPQSARSTASTQSGPGSHPTFGGSVPYPFSHSSVPPPLQFPASAARQSLSSVGDATPTATPVSTVHPTSSNDAFKDFEASFENFSLGNTSAAIPASFSDMSSAGAWPGMGASPPQNGFMPKSATVDAKMATTPHTATPHARTTATTSDGKPIMAAPTTLPDYSALEELFRGGHSSSSTATTSMFANSGNGASVPTATAAAPQSEVTIFGCKPLFTATSDTPPAGGSDFGFGSANGPVAKSTTIGGGFTGFYGSDSAMPSVGPPFYATAGEAHGDARTTGIHAGDIWGGAIFPASTTGVSSTAQPTKAPAPAANWNPFAS